MATDKSQNIDVFGRQELGWVVPEVLDSDRTVTAIDGLQGRHRQHRLADRRTARPTR